MVKESNQIFLCSSRLVIVEDGIIRKDPIFQGEGKVRASLLYLLDSFCPFGQGARHDGRPLREDTLTQLAVFGWLKMKKSRMGFRVFHMVSEYGPNGREGWEEGSCGVGVLSPCHQGAIRFLN